MINCFIWIASVITYGNSFKTILTSYDRTIFDFLIQETKPPVAFSVICPKDSPDQISGFKTGAEVDFLTVKQILEKISRFLNMVTLGP